VREIRHGTRELMVGWAREESCVEKYICDQLCVKEATEADFQLNRKVLYQNCVM
jgi:hypothetical protein